MRMHLRKFPHGNKHTVYYSECGRYTFRKDTSKLYRKITCKKCIRTKRYKAWLERR